MSETKQQVFEVIKAKYLELFLSGKEDAPQEFWNFVTDYFAWT